MVVVVVVVVAAAEKREPEEAGKDQEEERGVRAGGITAEMFRKGCCDTAKRIHRSLFGRGAPRYRFFVDSGIGRRNATESIL